MCREVSPTWLLVRQSQVIIVQIEPLEGIHRDHDISQGSVRPLHFEALVQVSCDGGLVVVIKLVQVLLRYRSLQFCDFANIVQFSIVLSEREEKNK